jgi:hypothetical protein
MLQGKIPMEVMERKCGNKTPLKQRSLEEDGKTKEKSVEELLGMNQKLSGRNREAGKLEKIIHHNALELTGKE